MKENPLYRWLETANRNFISLSTGDIPTVVELGLTPGQLTPDLTPFISTVALYNKGVLDPLLYRLSGELYLGKDKGMALIQVPPQIDVQESQPRIVLFPILNEVSLDGAFAPPDEWAPFLPNFWDRVRYLQVPEDAPQDNEFDRLWLNKVKRIIRKYRLPRAVLRICLDNEAGADIAVLNYLIGDNPNAVLDTMHRLIRQKIQWLSKYSSFEKEE